MLKYKIPGVVLCLALGAIIFAADEFPPDSLVPGWQKKGPVQVFDRNGLYGHINGGSELFLEFGFENLRLQKYHRGSDEISLERYRMDIPEAALAIYLARCGKETPVPGISVRNTGDYRQILFLHGLYFLIVDNFSGKADLLPVMIQLAEETLKCLPGPKEKKVDFSHLFSLLPFENRVTGSELLVRGYYSLQSIYTFGEGDILLLKNKIFGIAAEYKDKKGRSYNRLAVRYPDASDAQQALVHLRAHLDSYIQVLDRENNENGFTFKDYRSKYGCVRLEKQTLSIQYNREEIPERR